MIGRLLSVFCISLAILSAPLPSSAAAQTPPLLEARGNAEQCASLEAWTRIAQELGGENITGGTIDSQHFVARIPPAFADSVFEPLFGKPYRELSGRDKKNILDVMTRCMGKAANQSFLPYAFDTSARTNNSTRRDLLAAIENVSEADLERAQQAANRRIATERAYAANRPQLIARAFPGDPNAVRRNGLRDANCYSAPEGRYVAYNDYIYDGEQVVERRSDHVGWGQPCDGELARPNFIDGISSLLRHNRQGVQLFSIGDICGPTPGILYLTESRGFQMPEYGTPPPQSIGLHRGLFEEMPYKFYVASGSDGVIHPGIINPVEFGMLVTQSVVAKQCRRMPERIAVFGGTIVIEAGVSVMTRQALRSEDLEYTQYYSGSFDPSKLEERLTHDDPKMAATYAGFAAARLAYIEDEPERRRRREEAFAIGGFLVVLALLQLQTIDPCNNPDVPTNLKVLADCVNPFQ